MDYEEVTYNSTKTKLKPQLKSDENWEFQCRSLFSNTIQVLEEQVQRCRQTSKAWATT